MIEEKIKQLKESQNSDKRIQETIENIIEGLKEEISDLSEDKIKSLRKTLIGVVSHFEFMYQEGYKDGMESAKTVISYLIEDFDN